MLLRFSGGRGFVKVPSCLLACLTGKDGRDDELLVFRERSDQLFCLGRGLERVIRLTRRPLPCSALSETNRFSKWKESLHLQICEVNYGA